MASMTGSDFLRRAEAAAADLLRLSGAYAPTPLLDLSALAACLGVSQLLAKDESRRMLGSFKSLGGTYAGLRTLARLSGMDVSGLLTARPSDLPALICASDGNHGLAVAAAARFAGTAARIFLHSGVPAIRARRIEQQGGEIDMGAGAPTMTPWMRRLPPREGEPASWWPTRRTIPAIPSSAMSWRVTASSLWKFAARPRWRAIARRRTCSCKRASAARRPHGGGFEGLDGAAGSSRRRRAGKIRVRRGRLCA